MARGSKNTRARLLCGAAVASLTLWASAASAQDAPEINIPPQSLATALYAFAGQSGHQVMFAPELAGTKMTRGVTGVTDQQEALRRLLEGTELAFLQQGDTFLIVRASDPQSGSAAGDGAGTVEALIVTAQKREEDIQDVPIAISAFTQEDLTRSQVAGGPDLMTQVPNMTFTKTNFSSYSIQIRGIGTQAISATTDPAVAVAFNNTPFVRNRFFEQEFYDLQRIEVLRGPQGTLYGRNATAGVVNIISAKPKFVYEAKLSADASNYKSTRLEGMVNIPLVEDAVALRVAGAWTKRDGYVWNQVTDEPIDGRDLWSTRVSLRVAPSDAPFDLNLIWEHFEENDDRLRSGKQLCKTDVPGQINGIQIDTTGSVRTGIGTETGTYSQGCAPVSLYSPEAFQVPNGWALPYFDALTGLGFRHHDIDPYASATQSRDLRVIESTVRPEYKAKSEVFELQANVDLAKDLTLTSETSYSTDTLFSMQDLNRFNTSPGVFFQPGEGDRFDDFTMYQHGPNGGGIFCDPQIGCADRLVALDLSTADSTQFSQELRLGSSFDGPFNFSLGANYLRYDTMDKYYVFINTILQATLNLGGFSFIGDLSPTPWIPNQERRNCSNDAWYPPVPSERQKVPATGCLYNDPNPIGSLNDLGHNYFLSKNPYKLISYAVFGEAYYNFTDTLKLTAGLRWTVDKKEAPILPSMLLAENTIGLTVDHVEDQEWRKPSGRLALDWKPDLSFTDETLLYASYAHGYKAGGANPPPTAVINYANIGGSGALNRFATFPPTFEPEFVDAFEIGNKNTLLDSRLTLNTAAFYYNYKNYQISEIVERSALNRNFDAKVWGVELEADWRPIENLRLSFKGGYEKTRIGDGEKAIDLMDRANGGRPDENGVSYVTIKPFPATPSNCVIPKWLASWNGEIFSGVDAWGVCDKMLNGLDPVTQLPYVPNPTLASDNGGGTPYPIENISGFPTGFWSGYPGYDPRSANNSQGLYKQLGGNELPNAPNWTATLSGDYTIPLPNDWLATLHGDLHWQSGSYWRVFNDLEYDKLDEFYVVNVAAIFANEEHGWNIMAYVKNALDTDAMTGAFLFSDDTGLTTNVFLTEPRLYGLRVTKSWSGGPLLGSFGGRHDGPYPFTLELGGQVQRHDAPYEDIAPGFVSLFPEAVNPLDAQHRDLDWGDGREIRLIYRPGDTWRLGLGVRYGKANGWTRSLKQVQDPDYSCQAIPRTVGGGQGPCPTSTRKLYRSDYSESTVYSREKHTIVDFDIQRDFGIGSVGFDRWKSVIGGGLRYADLESETRPHIFGTPDWIMPPNTAAKYQIGVITEVPAQHDEYDAQIVASRTFKGLGPTLTWDMSFALFGNDETGRLDVDASLMGGALFGKQRTDITGDIVDNYYNERPNQQFARPEVTTVTPLAIRRSASATVPVADVSLGLSYTLDRFEMGAGYRWERYFNAIDGGYSSAEDADRTIDGPYFKLSVGFGG